MMSPAEAGQEDTYQWLLRALGTYLDEQPSCRICLTEVPEGFVVLFQRALHKLEPELHRFDRHTLHEQLNNLYEQRRSPPKARHQGIWQGFPNGHSDFFRALGYELDEESAKNVLVDEVEDGIVVAYSKPEGRDWTKRLVFLSIQDIENVLNTAFERRGALAPTPE